VTARPHSRRFRRRRVNYLGRDERRSRGDLLECSHAQAGHVIVGLAAFVLIPHEVAAAVKLTSQQVETVCGNKLKTEASGVSGCYKDCGLNNAHYCEFTCYKGDCYGACVTCGRAEKRSGFFPKLYSNRVVRRALRASP
jgi:hypothetical protein